MTTAGDVTLILDAFSGGSPRAADELLKPPGAR